MGPASTKESELAERRERSRPFGALLAGIVLVAVSVFGFLTGNPNTSTLDLVLWLMLLFSVPITCGLLFAGMSRFLQGPPPRGASYFVAFVVIGVGVGIGAGMPLVFICQALGSDPNRPLAAPLIVFGLSLLIAVVRARLSPQKLLDTGSDANATIIEVADTGWSVNRNPRVRLQLQVHPVNGDPPFSAKVTLVISRLGTSAVRPGATLRVKYDARDQRKVAIAE